MPDIFEVLASDHAEVQQMLTALAESPTVATGADERVIAARKQLVQQLVMAESRHEAAEEQYFWPAVRDRLADGNDLADQAVGQENEAKQVLNRLDKLDADDPEFEQLLAEFTAAGRQHIQFEETRVWPGLREALSKSEAGELGAKVAQAEEHGPTRPHPNTPASPGVLKAAGPAAAAMDRLRDAVTGRGRS